MIVVATQDEYRNFKRDYNSIFVTGVGYGNVIRSLADIPRDTPILNIGYAGSNSIPKGTVCFVKECRHYHPNVDYEEPIYRLDGEYICYTSDDFVLHTDIEEPVLFDMELYAILSMGFTDVTAVKIVSDNLSLEEYEDQIQ
jgi:hypothetical protein